MLRGGEETGERQGREEGDRGGDKREERERWENRLCDGERGERWLRGFMYYRSALVRYHPINTTQTCPSLENTERARHRATQRKRERERETDRERERERWAHLH